MTTLRSLKCDDLFKINNVNFDPLTETYSLPLYTHYLAMWPEYLLVIESPNGQIIGYILAKAEGFMDNWHGHVTALTVSADYRRLGLAATLMNLVEIVFEKKRAYFVDLFVRKSNEVAIKMYKNLGYIIYRTILEYYCNEKEDAYEMRKALSRDVEKKSIVPCNQTVRPEDLDTN
ncbi:N-alpha-acetyltransferase 20-like [Teleopsis dalmanni]|uniref:N-alpha-acetyltransferase 20-like n=1 Tax=Teleopsis dalmanni TaxID=139649 RepID=UPI0018CD43DB|nr:N-alpha-acetyltransferase 20-like [Teleopsis dalmanni]